MIFYTMDVERGTTNRVLAESLAAFYSRKLSYYVFVCVSRPFDKECEIY